MNFFISFYRSITSISFYKSVMQVKVVEGVKYLLFLSALSTLILFFAFLSMGMPKVVEFIDWVKIEMPIITMTDEGVSIDVDSPYEMIHPELGALATFNTSVDSVGNEEIQKQFIFVTKSKVYTRQSGGDIRVYEVSQAVGQQTKRRKDAEPVFITPETVQKIYDGSKPWLLALLGVIIFVFFFIWKIVAAVFYAWLGLIANMQRRDPLSFSQIFTIALFAMTASIVLQWLETTIPLMGNLPFSGMLGILITSVYMFLAVRKTEDPAESFDAPN